MFDPVATAAAPSPVSPVKPVITRTHLSLFVRDPEASAQWFADVLDMQITARGPQWVFLSFGRKHHDLALIRAESGAQQGGLGLQHYGLEIDGDVEELRRLYGMLRFPSSGGRSETRASRMNERDAALVDEFFLQLLPVAGQIRVRGGARKCDLCHTDYCSMCTCSMKSFAWRSSMVANSGCNWSSCSGGNALGSGGTVYTCHW